MAVCFPRRFAASCLAWLVAALILAQGQGLLHGIVHAHWAADEQHDHLAHVVADTGAGHEHYHGHDASQPDNWLLRLFAVHDGESACRLFDQSSLGSCVPSFAASTPVLLLAGAFVDFFEARHRVPVPTVARARGPPPVH